MKLAHPRLFAITLVALLGVGGNVPAAGIHWSGPTVDFANPAGGSAVDVLIPGAVAFSRGAVQGLFNAAVETSYSGDDSPLGTLWAVSGLNGSPAFDFGEGANLGAGLVFSNWRTAYGSAGQLAGNIVGTAAVVKIPGALPAEDIFVDLVFSDWGVGGGAQGIFAYTRSSPVPLPAALPLLSAALCLLVGQRRYRGLG